MPWQVADFKPPVTSAFKSDGVKLVDHSSAGKMMALSVAENYTGIDYSGPNHHLEKRRQTWAGRGNDASDWKGHDPYFIVKDPNNLNQMLVHELSRKDGTIRSTQRVPLYGKFRKEIVTRNSLGCKDIRGYPKGVEEQLLNGDLSQALHRYANGTTGIPTDLFNQFVDTRANALLHRARDPNSKVYF